MSAAAHDAAAWALAFALCVPGLAGRPVRGLAVLLAGVILLHVPVAGVSPLGALRGVFGGLSVTTLVLLATLFTARCSGARVLARGEALFAVALAAGTGLLFYPPALGLGPVDPYAWGYAGAGPALAAGVLAFACALAGRWAVAAALGAALVLWRLRWLDSFNLWDYLVDPLLAIAGVVALTGAAVVALRRRAR